MTFEQYLTQLNITRYADFSKYISKLTFYKFGGGLQTENTVERYIFTVLHNKYKESELNIDNVPTSTNDDFARLFAVIADTYHFNFTARFKYLQDFGNKSASELGLDESSSSTYYMKYDSKYKGANTPTQYYDDTADFDDTYTNEKNEIEKTDNRANSTTKHKGTLSELDEINKIREDLTQDIIGAFAKLFKNLLYDEC